MSSCRWKHITVQALYQLFWLFLCLYGLPVLINGYGIATGSAFYMGDASTATSFDHVGGKYEGCVYELTDKYCDDGFSGEGSSATCRGWKDYDSDKGLAWSTGTVTSVCNFMTYCGFPYSQDGKACPGNPGILSGLDQCILVCNSTTACDGDGCSLNDELNSAKTVMAKMLQERQADDYMRPLTVLFNAFIWCQVRCVDDVHGDAKLLINTSSMSSYWLILGLNTLIIH